MGNATNALLRIFFLLVVGLFTFNSIVLIRYWHKAPLPVGVTVGVVVANCVFSLGIIIKLFYDLACCCDRGPKWVSV